MKYLTAEEFEQMVSWSNQSHIFFINYAFIGENTREVSIIPNFSRLQTQCAFLATYMWQSSTELSIAINSQVMTPGFKNDQALIHAAPH